MIAKKKLKYILILVTLQISDIRNGFIVQELNNENVYNRT